MKILILSDDFPPKSFGGAGIVAFDQARELAKRGHNVSVITTTRESRDDGVIIYDGLTVYRIHTDYNERWRAYLSLYNPRTVSRVDKILSEFSPDVVHAHNVHYFLSYHTLSLARRYAKAVFLTAHDAMSFHYGKLYPAQSVSPDGEKEFNYRVYAWRQLMVYRFRFNPFRNIAIRYYLKKIDRIFAVSHSLAEALRQNGIFGAKVLHNGIDVERFVASLNRVAEFKRKYGLQDKKVLFFAGRISRAKGGDKALAALIEVSKVLPEVCLLIAGKTDAYVQELTEKAKGAGVSKNVVVTGWLTREEIVSAYGVSDIVLTLSVYADPLVLVNLEAMAARKPVVGTCLGGTPEVVVDGETGYIVDPNNIAQVVDRISSLLKDQALAFKFGDAGYDRVLREFSLSGKVDEIEKNYKEVLAGGNKTIY
ncbi:MAG: glycosyltransferase family 4 protein [Candidatus Paceibacterota bacterium]|jgi:glycosyltransferase involved in cell wall biosynthesis